MEIEDAFKEDGNRVDEQRRDMCGASVVVLREILQKFPWHWIHILPVLGCDSTSVSSEGAGQA